MVMSPAGPGTKNDCGGKGQQQFSQLTDQESESVCLTSRFMSPTWPRIKNVCAGKGQQQITVQDQTNTAVGG
jgi:hypothetical protein